jgi:hypothetical protein
MKTLYTSLTFLLLVTSNSLLAQPTSTPDAPDLSVSYLDGVMTLDISNGNPISNNYNEAFEVEDGELPDEDNTWYFQGYLIYQIQLGFDELDFYDSDVARLAFQMDLEDDLETLTNNQFDTDLGLCIPQLMVQGGNSGLQYSLDISIDLWTGQPFVEGDVYCYVALAYAAHQDGENPDCDGLPYQFIRSQQAAAGSLILQCRTASNPMGVGEGSANLSKCYPNPASSTVSGAWSNLNVCLLTADGKLVEQIYNQNDMNVDHLPEGSYVLYSYANDGSILSREKLIIAR